MKNFLILLFVGLSASSSIYAQTDPKQERYDRLKQLEQFSERSITFYGTIKDQFGQPIANTIVTCGIECFSLTSLYFVDVKTVSVKTDSNGLFTINESGKSLFVRDIKKEGYKFNPDDPANTRRSFEYSNLNDTNFFTPDVNNPVVFILYKKPQPGYVIRKYLDGIEKKSGFKYRAALPNGLFDFEDQFYNKLKSPFVFSFEPTTDPDDYRLEFKASDVKDGFVEKSGDPHLAPEQGYGPLLSFHLKTGDKVDKNIYFRQVINAKENLYARLEIKLEIMQENVYLTAYLYTNMEGNRNLEYDAEYTEQKLKNAH